MRDDDPGWPQRALTPGTLSVQEKLVLEKHLKASVEAGRQDVATCGGGRGGQVEGAGERGVASEEADDTRHVTVVETGRRLQAGAPPQTGKRPSVDKRRMEGDGHHHHQANLERCSPPSKPYSSSASSASTMWLEAPKAAAATPAQGPLYRHVVGYRCNSIEAGEPLFVNLVSHCLAPHASASGELIFGWMGDRPRTPPVAHAAITPAPTPPSSAASQHAPRWGRVSLPDDGQQRSLGTAP